MAHKRIEARLAALELAVAELTDERDSPVTLSLADKIDRIAGAAHATELSTQRRIARIKNILAE